MKFQSILFPIDFSDRSSALNRQVEWLAAQFGSRVTLLHVFEIPAAWYGPCEASFVNMECFNALKDSASQRLKEYVLKVPENRPQRVLLEGNPGDEILNWVNEHDIDLIVMGTHGYGALQGCILGSVTAKVLHRAICPVWTGSILQREAKSTGIAQILCAVEVTEDTVPLLRFANNLAQELGATVRLIHSVPELETRPNWYFDFDLHSYLMELARVEIAKMQREAATEFPLAISELPISDALAQAAKEHRADLIVIGRGKAQKLLGRFQTHAYEIIRHAPCPVLSYSVNQLDRISSSCSAERLCQCAEDGQLLTGSRRS